MLHWTHVPECGKSVVDVVRVAGTKEEGVGVPCQRLSQDPGESCLAAIIQSAETTNKMHTEGVEEEELKIFLINLVHTVYHITQGHHTVIIGNIFLFHYIRT